MGHLQIYRGSSEEIFFQDMKEIKKLFNILYSNLLHSPLRVIKTK